MVTLATVIRARMLLHGVTLIETRDYVDFTGVELLALIHRKAKAMDPQTDPRRHPHV